ncbi:hypothetical protein HY382_00885 [Candidatus Curtissbacteria bacterium]|nr:hypothetical protein [Candidatus Curtissbacteria bacterium]
MKKTSRLVSFFRPVSTRIRGVPAPLKTKAAKIYKKIYTSIKARPITAFLLSLLLLLLIIAGGNFLTRPKKEEAPKVPPKKVDVYTIGKTPTIKVAAQIQKDGVVQIVAQTPGIVQKISVTEGDKVNRGSNIASLSTNYQGGNAASLARQLAQVQAANVNETFDTQKEIIAKQRDIVNKGAENTDELRKISVDSLNDTNSLLNLNQNIVDTLNANLKNLEENNAGGVNDQLILATKQQVSSFQAAVNQLSSASRNLSFTTSTEKAPTQLSNLSKDLTLKQLEVQQKTLELSKKVAQIQLNIARVNEAVMFPASPISGTVQKIFVDIGQSVSPGTPIASITGSGNVSAVASVPYSIAANTSKIDESTLHFANRTIAAFPRFVTTEATNGQLYSIIYDVDQEFQSELTNLEYITVEIPIGTSDTNSIVPFIPIDSVFQTQDTAFIYVVKDLKASAKNIILGNVLGDQVEVKEGLADGDLIILNRNIIEGELVSIKQ